MRTEATEAEYAAQRSKVRGAAVRSPEASPAPQARSRGVASSSHMEESGSGALSAASVKNHDHAMQVAPATPGSAGCGTIVYGTDGKRKRTQDGGNQGGDVAKGKKPRYDPIVSLQAAAQFADGLDVSEPLSQVECMKVLEADEAAAKIEQHAISNGVYSTHYCKQTYNLEVQVNVE